MNIFNETKKIFIEKKSDSEYNVNFFSGYYAHINVLDHIMFVDIFSNENFSLTRFCTLMLDKSLSNEEFVTNNVYDNILFNIDCVKDFIYDNNDLLRDSCFLMSVDGKWKGVSFNNFYYPTINFKRKQIIKNVFKYTFKAFQKNGVDSYFAQYYKVDDILLSICNLNNYIKKNDQFGLTRRFIVDINTYENHLNMENVLMLKINNGNYCYLKKENKKIMLVYLDKFNEKTTVLKRTPAFIKMIKYLLNIKTIHDVYKDSKIIEVSWDKGRINKSSSLFNMDIIKQHQCNIFDGLNDKLKKLQLKHPSEAILQSLVNLGLQCTLPLSQDVLTVLEMHEI